MAPSSMRSFSNQPKTKTHVAAVTRKQSERYLFPLQLSSLFSRLSNLCLKVSSLTSRISNLKEVMFQLSWPSLVKRLSISEILSHMQLPSSHYDSRCSRPTIAIKEIFTEVRLIISHRLLNQIHQTLKM